VTDQTTDFFDGIGEGAGAPTAVLKNVNDFVYGEIVKMTKRDYVPFGKTDPEKNADGSAKQQLVIVLQTDLRNWQGVVKVPKVDPADPNSAEKAPSEDDGTRAVYVPEGKNLQFAIGRAVQAAAQAAGQQVQFGVGGKLGVKVFNLKPTDKGNPLKEHEARYEPKAAGSDFFAGTPAQEAPAAPAQPAAPAPAAEAPAPAQAAPAAPAQDPWATQSPQAAPAGDPWATAPAQSQPPF